MVFSDALAAFTIPHTDGGSPHGSDLLLSYHDNDHYNTVRSNLNMTVPASKASTPSDCNGADTKLEKEEKKKVVKRGDPCTCGSGINYKKCCFGKDKNETRLQKKNRSKKESSSLPLPDVDDSLEQTFRIMAI